MVTVRIEQLNFIKKGVSCSIEKYYTHTQKTIVLIVYLTTQF